MMKRLLAVAAVTAALSVPSIGHAHHEGCYITIEQATKTCTYTASGPGEYVATPRGNFKVTVVRDGRTVVLARDDQNDIPASTGTVATRAGEVVTVEATGRVLVDFYYGFVYVGHVAS